MYYNNGFESTYEELVSFYPAFYRDVLEMKAILEANGRVCDTVIDTINGILENAFVNSADEATISRLEAFLNVTPTAGSSLEERRRLVYSFFVGFGKMSASKIKETIRALTGADSSVSFEETDDAGNNSLIIEFERGENPEISLDDINTVLSRKIPAHVAYETYLKYKPAMIVNTKEILKNYVVNNVMCGTALSGTI